MTRHFLSLAEVKTWLDKTTSQNQPLRESFLAGPRVSVDLNDVMLREIMNAIIKVAGMHAWLFTRRGENQRTLHVIIS